jgi:hypothetical protein
MAKESKHVLTQQLLDEFNGLCNHAYDAWVMHRTLFDDNPRSEQLNEHGTGPFFSNLFDITQAYVLHQICKLHDEALSHKRANLTIDFVVRFGPWDDGAKAELVSSKERLDNFAQQHLRLLRNRALSHNDVETILANEPLGAFPDGDDRRYFEELEGFVNTAANAMLGHPEPFHLMAESDVFLFLNRLLGIQYPAPGT